MFFKHKKQSTSTNYILYRSVDSAGNHLILAKQEAQVVALSNHCHLNLGNDIIIIKRQAVNLKRYLLEQNIIKGSCVYIYPDLKSDLYCYKVTDDFYKLTNYATIGA